MTIPAETIRKRLKEFDVQTLFVEDLGWDHTRQDLRISVEGVEMTLGLFAHKRGFGVLRCPPVDGSIPSHQMRRKIDREVTRAIREHMIVYVSSDLTDQVWQWTRRDPGLPVRCRETWLNVASRGDLLIQRLRDLAFTLEEEGQLTILDASSRVRVAFDVERVTSRFYDKFKSEHASFLRLISGIDDESDREWYASVMLNRLMFVYFIQRKGFLDGDTDYLRTRLVRCQQDHGKDKFYPFYRHFLLRLFHEGFGARERNQGLDGLLGRIPYLNGGLFDIHELEKPDRYGTKIGIPDVAFKRIFDYFDEYQWYLDERPLRADNEINPDVLGYIFEKYVNQKQMGAYYTKEDVTEYICRNTVIPALLDATRSQCQVAFEASGGPTVWGLLEQDPDRYIPSLPLGVDEPSADNMATSAKASWLALMAQRPRHEEIRAKLIGGTVKDVGDLITLNIDIRQFCQDAIEQCESPELLRAFWHAIESITVLDPTCGSGAFLFAALNVLEPLYEACLERMEAFLNDPGAGGEGVQKGGLRDFRTVLERVSAHPNRRYFVLKSIILNNLFGVDIMAEAVEICKLRLFLKLVAQVEPDSKRTNLGIEPLPDIDFNVRAGNTLVGFVTYDDVRKGILGDRQGKMDLFSDMTKIAERAAELQQTFDAFRVKQTEGDNSGSAVVKLEIRARLTALQGELDRYLASEHGLDTSNAQAYGSWHKIQQPFHWFLEFHRIMSRGGFDVVVGNPPYVSSRKVEYLARLDSTKVFSDIYAMVVLRALMLVHDAGRCGMIVPLSITFSEDFGELRHRVCDSGAAWVSSYDNIPAALFAGVSQRCTIWISDRSREGCHASPMYRWRSASRPHLMQTIGYYQVPPVDVEDVGIPKLVSATAGAVLTAIHSPSGKRQREVVTAGRKGAFSVGYSQTARNFVSAFRTAPPCLDAGTLQEIPSSKIGHIGCRTLECANASLVSLAGELYFYYWLIRGDGFDVTGWIVRDYLRCLEYVPEPHFRLLSQLGICLHDRRLEALVFKKNAGKYVGNFNYRGHLAITRRADLVLLAGLGLGRQEALDVFDYVQRLLSINVLAGEKGIPLEVKSRFRPKPVDEAAQWRLLGEADALVMKHFGFNDKELALITSYDTRLCAHVDGDESDGE